MWHEARPKDFSVVLRRALHLSRSAPAARCDLPSDKGRLFGRPLRLTVLVMQRSPLGEGKKFQPGYAKLSFMIVQNRLACGLASSCAGGG